MYNGVSDEEDREEEGVKSDDEASWQASARAAKRRSKIERGNLWKGIKRKYIKNSPWGRKQKQKAGKAF